jgi:hypothetical protein
MAKTKISEYDSTAGNNTDINSINIDEGCSPSGINNAIRALMSHLKNWQGGTSGDALPIASGGTGAVTAGTARTALSAAASGANSDITSITGLTIPLTVAQGGTGASTSATAAFALKGANADITSITGLTTALTVVQGGTGSATLTANSVVLGNGTSALSGNLIAPSTSGNVLTSNGTTWTSASPTVAITSYLITSSSDITLSGGTINGTTGQSGQSNVGSSFTMNIPATGIITFASIAGKYTNDATSAAHSTAFGIRIGTTNYWFGYNDLSTPSYAYTSFITGGSSANVATNLYGGGNSTSSGTAIDVVSAGVPTGSQTVQLIAASSSATTGGTINGATRQTRVRLLTIS